MSEQARLVRDEFGLSPQTPGWFVVNLAEARWFGSEELGAVCRLEGEYKFPHTGVNVRLLQPGQPACYYHEEDRQEDFLVLFGECLLLVDGEERRLRTHDFVHCAPFTPHVFVGAGEAPCLVLMIGDRAEGSTVRYPVSELALRHGAGVQKETDDPRVAYAALPQRQPIRCPLPR